METRDVKQLQKAFNGNLDLVLFFLAWVKNERNATKAYHELNPTVDPASAQVLGSRQLAKIDLMAVMKCYGLGVEEYLEQLKAGHEATKWNDFTGEREADHKTRGEYNKRLGKILRIETEVNLTQNNLQINNSDVVVEFNSMETTTNE